MASLQKSIADLGAGAPGAADAPTSATPDLRPWRCCSHWVRRRASCSVQCRIYYDHVDANLVGVTFFVGSVLFTSAARSKVRASATHERLFSRTPPRLNWWSAAVQWAGTLEFNVSTFAALVIGSRPRRSDGSCGPRISTVRLCSSRRASSRSSQWERSSRPVATGHRVAEHGRFDHVQRRGRRGVRAPDDRRAHQHPVGERGARTRRSVLLRSQCVDGTAGSGACRGPLTRRLRSRYGRPEFRSVGRSSGAPALATCGRVDRRVGLVTTRTTTTTGTAPDAVDSSCSRSSSSRRSRT